MRLTVADEIKTLESSFHTREVKRPGCRPETQVFFHGIWVHRRRVAALLRAFRSTGIKAVDVDGPGNGAIRITFPRANYLLREESP